MAFERRMSHLDAALYALETPTNHMHLGLLATFAPTVAGENIVERVRAQIGDATGYNSLRLVVHPQLGGLASPVLVDGGPVDLDYHVREVTLVSGGEAGVNAWIGDELSRQLDRSRPLWTVTVLRGLEGGGFGVFVKGHHGVFDGVAALKVAVQIFQGKPLTVERRTAPPVSKLHRTIESIGEVSLWPARVARLLTDRTRRNVKLAHLGKRPMMFSAPRSELNRSISERRCVSRCVLSLADVAEVRRSANCTANDVAIALVSTAVRQVLMQRGGLPRRPMVALIPAAQSGADWGRRSGNRLSFWFVSMATNIASPIERLRVIADSSRAARFEARIRGTDLWDRLGGGLLPGPLNLMARVAEKLKASDYIPPLASMIISNVTGPRFAIEFAGAKLTGLYPFGPPKDGGAINVTMVSHGSQIFVGLQGDTSLADHIDEIAAQLPIALAELESTLVG